MCTTSHTLVIELQVFRLAEQAHCQWSYHPSHSTNFRSFFFWQSKYAQVFDFDTGNWLESMTTGQLKNKQMFLLLFTNVLQICSEGHVIHLQMAVSLCNPGYLISLGQLPVCFRTSQREQKAPFQPCGTIPGPSELSTSIFILLFFFPLTLVVLLPWQSVVIIALSSCHLYTKGFSHLISQAISYYISVPPTVMTGFPFLLDTLFIKIEPIFS